MNINLSNRGVSFSSPKVTKVLAIFFIITGLIIVVSGFLAQKSTNEKKERYIPTDAVVYDYDERIETEIDEDGFTHREHTYAKKYEYYVEEERYTITGAYSSSVPVIGSSETLLYNPENPRDYVMANSNPIGMSIFGGIMAIFGIGILVFTIHKERGY